MHTTVRMCMYLGDLFIEDKTATVRTGHPGVVRNCMIHFLSFRLGMTDRWK